MVKSCFERVFMLLLRMFGFVAFLIRQYCYVFMLEKAGSKKYVVSKFRSMFIVGLSFWEVNSQSLLWLLRKLGVSR